MFHGSYFQYIADTKNGKEVTKPEESFVNKNVKVIDGNNKAVISVDGEEVVTLKNSKKNPMIQEDYSNGFYFADDEKLIVFIEK